MTIRSIGYGRIAACALAAGALGTTADAGLVKAIHTNLDGDPTAQVPGVDGAQFRTPLAPFLSLYGSPNGQHWIFKAFTDDPDSNANDVIIVGSGDGPGSAVALEGQAIPGLVGLTYGFMDSDCGINDSGQYAFGNRTSGGTTATDETIFEWNGVVLTPAVVEGSPAPGLVDPPGVPGDELFGNSLNSAHILNDGTVCFRADLIQNVATDYRSALYEGLTPVAQEGTSAATVAGADVYDSFVALSGNTFSHDADGTSWIVEADLQAGFGTDEGVVVGGTVMLRDGDTVGASTVDAIFAVDMGGDGTWYARGDYAGDTDWAVRDGVLVAATGTPITSGASEAWGDVISAINGNSSGDYVVVGTTDAADAATNEVAVLNGRKVLVRKGDPVDLNGNGLPDDDLFVGGFDANDIVLSDDFNDDLLDDRTLYFLAPLVNGAGVDVGDGFLRFSLADCPGDFDQNGSIGFGDLNVVLAAWGPCTTFTSCAADLDGNGSVGFTDLNIVLNGWGPCP